MFGETNGDKISIEFAIEADGNAALGLGARLDVLN